MQEAHGVTEVRSCWGLCVQMVVTVRTGASKEAKDKRGTEDVCIPRKRYEIAWLRES